MSSISDSIYVDANVLVNWLVPDNSQDSRHASSFIEAVENKKLTAVITELTLNEFAKVLRVILVKQGYTNPQYWAEQLDICMNRIYQLPDNVQMISSNSISSDGKNYQFFDITSDAYGFIMKYPGKTKQMKKHKEHNGLSTVDTLHIAIACKLGCSIIVTSDKGFEDVKEIRCKRPEELL